jgi:hypothetical protein
MYALAWSSLRDQREAVFWSNEDHWPFVIFAVAAALLLELLVWISQRQARLSDRYLSRERRSGTALSGAARQAVRMGAFIVAASALGFAVLTGMVRQQAARQHACVQQITEAGGIVHFDYVYRRRYPSGLYNQFLHLPPVSHTLRLVLGEQTILQATEIELPSGAIRAELFRSLSHLPYVVSLSAESGRFDNQALIHLGNLPKLARLSLSGSSVDDNGLAHLRQCRQLNVLNLDNTQIGDAGLVQLAALAEVHELSLCSNQISDDGVAALAGMYKLELLNLAGTNITDRAVRHLNSIRALMGVNVTNTGITEQGLLQLRPGISLGNAQNCQM